MRQELSERCSQKKDPNHKHYREATTIPTDTWEQEGLYIRKSLGKSGTVGGKHQPEKDVPC